jgi:hypothetical protein
VKPSERIPLIKRLARTVGQEDWEEIDLTLRQFDLPWSHEWEDSNPVGYVIAHIETADDEKLLELEEYLLPTAEATPRSGGRSPGTNSGGTRKARGSSPR